MNMTSFLKFTDKVIGRIFCILCPSSSVTATTLPKPKHILVIRPGGIGDAVLTMPLIKAIIKSHPDAKIDILAEKRNHSVYSACPGLRSVYQYDRPKQLLSVISNTYDVIIDTEQWHRLSAVIARLCNPQILIGYDTNERRRLLTHAIPYSHEDYEVNCFLKLTSPLGSVSLYDPESPFIHISNDLNDVISNILRPLAGRRFIALFPGASIVEKRWDDRKFVALAEKLNNYGFTVVVLGADGEKRLGDKIIAACAYGLNLAGRISLLESTAVIQRSSLLVSGDSGVLHIAAGLGVPTVSLFGPSNIKKWAPRGGRHVVVTRNLPCSPCSAFGYTPKCSIQVRCMADITVDDVMTAVDRLIGIISLEEKSAQAKTKAAGEDQNGKG